MSVVSTMTGVCAVIFVFTFLLLEFKLVKKLTLSLIAVALFPFIICLDGSFEICVLGRKEAWGKWKRRVKRSFICGKRLGDWLKLEWTEEDEEDLLEEMR